MNEASDKTVIHKVAESATKAPLVPGIKNIIAIGSGKGGVGKSTTAVNLALALQAAGLSIGLLDADIYGPNQPLLLGVDPARKAEVDAARCLQPINQYNLQTMSMGYLLQEQGPVVWRGPMISRALEQMVYQTAWVGLDYLIVDLPPGTGDISLTLAQKIPLCGVVLVSTPQAVAVSDTEKALQAFQKLAVPILGLIENMGAHRCTQCGHEEAIFGVEGGQALARAYNVPLLGCLPLDFRIQAQSERGLPIVIAEPEGDLAAHYRAMAGALLAVLSAQPKAKTLLKPTIV